MALSILQTIYIGEDQNAGHYNLGCISYTSDFIAWAIPPSNQFLKDYYPEVGNLMFTPDQTNKAMPVFKNNSGFSLHGSNTKFSVEMSRYSFI
jgi:hypothetical protein